MYLTPIIIALITAFSFATPSTILAQRLNTTEETLVDEQSTSPAEMETTLEVVRQRRLTLREEIEARRRQAQTKAQPKREELRERLRDLREAQKRRTLENLDSRLEAVKNKWVEHWLSILSRLNEILAKLEARVGESIAEEVLAAEAAIANAEEVLKEIAGTSYVIEFSDEQGLGEDVRNLIAQFKADLTKGREVVFEAREAVQAAFAAAREEVASEE